MATPAAPWRSRTQIGRRLPVGVATSLIVLLLAAAFGGTIWRYEHAQSEARAALELRGDRLRDRAASTVQWHEREAINEYLITGAPGALAEVKAQQAEFARLTERKLTPGGDSPELGEARIANDRMIRELERQMRLASVRQSGTVVTVAAIDSYEQAVLAPLRKMDEVEAAVERRRAHAAASAWTQARLVAILALLAALGFAIYVYRLLRQVTRQADDLQRTLAEREQTHAALQDREHQLRQAQKTEAVGRLAGGVAHDFNNMLLAIIGYGALALADVEPQQGGIRHALEQIELAAGRAAGLTAQLLAFSRQQVLQPQIIDVNGLVNGLTGMLRPLLGATIDLRLDLDPSAGAVGADPGQLEQVITNLVVNGRDAMPGGGKITISTAKADASDLPGALMHGQYVAISVADTGEGMDEETQSRALDPFFTTKEQGKGTGLGLATVHGIVTQSGGEIRIESAPGAGTTISVYLPSTDAEPAVAVAAAPTVSSGGTETVLLVEDDPVVQLLLYDVLVQAGYKVSVAGDGAQALALVERMDVTPDLLLTDLVMPRMGGRELARELQPFYPAMRQIYMSGFTEDVALYDDAEAGRVTFVQKPFTPNDILRTIRAVLAPASVEQAAAVAGPR
jgi:signal transduction histidine kinase/ActR/RegA family two-component response regulator